MKDGRELKKELLERKLIFDGAFGTYYSNRFDTDLLPEYANLNNPQQVKTIHGEYLEAGADILRTNTYASNTVSLGVSFDEVAENVRNAYALAAEAVEHSGREAYVAADIGPIPYDDMEERQQAVEEYRMLARTFLEAGATLFVFETFPSMEDLMPALEEIGDRAFVILQFAVNQFGYGNAGLGARRLLENAAACPYIDGVGLNCGVGPGHMQKILLEAAPQTDKFLTALPNAGYPQKLSGRMQFSNENLDYFAEKVCRMGEEVADLVGGCCGTTPEYI